MPRNCNCAGPCGAPDEDDNVSRREFITLVGGAAGLIALTPRSLQAGETRLEEAASAKRLAEWKQSLQTSAVPRRYLSGVHNDARFPLGGIGTGNIEIGADGQLTNWQLFNTLRDGFVPFYFAIRSGATAKLLQTAGGTF